MSFQHDSSSLILANGANSSGTWVGQPPVMLERKVQKRGSSADAYWISRRETAAWRVVCSDWMKSSSMSTGWLAGVAAMTALENRFATMLCRPGMK